MLKHHEESIQNLVSYYKDGEGVIAVILDGSIVHGNARPDSDIDAVIVVTEEEYEKRKGENRLAEVVTGHCTYEGGYFDVKFKSKKVLELAAERASEPTRNAYLGAVTVYTKDDDIPGLVERISAYPEGEIPAKVRCFNGNLQLNCGYFLACVKEDNAYMRAHSRRRSSTRCTGSSSLRTACSFPATAVWRTPCALALTAPNTF